MPWNKCRIYLHDNLVSVDWLYWVHLSIPIWFGNGMKEERNVKGKSSGQGKRAQTYTDFHRDGKENPLWTPGNCELTLPAKEKCENEAFTALKTEKSASHASNWQWGPVPHGRWCGLMMVRRENSLTIKRHTGRFYLKNRTVTDMINFLVQEGSSYLESVCAEGGDGVSG